jgi:hypothetical protein
MQRMTVKEYSDLRGISPQAVIKAINKKHCVSGLVSHEKFNGVYILYIDVNQVVVSKPKKSLKKLEK